MRGGQSMADSAPLCVILSRYDFTASAVRFGSLSNEAVANQTFSPWYFMEHQNLTVHFCRDFQHHWLKLNHDRASTFFYR